MELAKMRFRNWTGWALLALVTLGGSTVPVHGGGLIRDSNPPDIALVFTGDVIGYLDPCG
jgi:hypothetical protein